MEPTKTPPRTAYAPISFGAVLVCFFLTFVNVSCQGNRVVSFSGIQLAIGTEVRSKSPFGGPDDVKKVEPDKFAMAALVAAVAGFLLSFGRSKTRILTITSGVAGIVMLLLLRNEIEQNIVQTGSGMLSVDFAGGFYAALILFAAAAIVSYRSERTAAPSLANPSVSPPLAGG